MMRILVSFSIGMVLAIVGSSLIFSYLTPQTQDLLRSTAIKMYSTAKGEVDSIKVKIPQITYFVSEILPASSNAQATGSNELQNEAIRTRERLKRKLNEFARTSDLKVDDLIHEVSTGWSATLDSGTVVNLGETDIFQRFNRYLRTRDTLDSVSEQVISVVDTRYEHGLAITRKDGRSDGTQTTNQ